jgi:release factor glutamine methyltransferase
MQLKAALQAAVRRLDDQAVGSPRLNAEVLLMFTLGCDRAYLYAHPERELMAPEMERYCAALDERARGVPAQYITGHQEFWGLDLIVSPAVLIPRPETEHLVETVLELAAAERLGAEAARPLRLVDVGTGSGAIALALAQELPQAKIWAADISPAALEVAQANAARLELAGRVHFVESDLLAAFAAPMTFDFIVSNPPYVGEGEADKVQREVKKFEPHVAVFAGPDGLDVIRRLAPQALAALRPAGWLLLEIGYTQEAAVRALLGTCHRWSELRTVPDLQGIPRVVVARK